MTAASPRRVPSGARTTGIPPPPPAIATAPLSITACTREMSATWRGSGEGTTWRHPRPASSRIVQPRVAWTSAASASS